MGPSSERKRVYRIVGRSPVTTEAEEHRFDPTPDQEHREDAFVMKKSANREGSRPRKGPDGRWEVCSWRKRLTGPRKGIEGKGSSDKKADGEQAFLS